MLDQNNSINSDTGGSRLKVRTWETHWRKTAPVVPQRCLDYIWKVRTPPLIKWFATQVAQPAGLSDAEYGMKMRPDTGSTATEWALFPVAI